MQEISFNSFKIEPMQDAYAKGLYAGREVVMKIDWLDYFRLSLSEGQQNFQDYAVIVAEK